MLNLLAQTTYDFTETTVSTSGSSTAGLIFIVLYLALLVVLIVGMWKMFKKAGKPGWASIVPIYNVVVLLEIAGKPLWWILLMLIPFVNIVVGILLGIEVAKKFGKSSAYGAILCGLLGIGYSILGFSSAQYQGASAQSSASNNQTTPPAAPTAPDSTPPAPNPPAAPVDTPPSPTPPAAPQV